MVSTTTGGDNDKEMQVGIANGGTGTGTDTAASGKRQFGNVDNDRSSKKVKRVPALDPAAWFLSLVDKDEYGLEKAMKAHFNSGGPNVAIATAIATVLHKTAGGDRQKLMDILVNEDIKAKISEEYNKKTLSPSQALSELSNDRNCSLRYLNVIAAGEPAKAFYVEGPKRAKFRHNGINKDNIVPGSVYVRKDKADDNTVFSSFSSSGSGKTVDLVSMAFIRRKDLTLYLHPGHDITMDETEKQLQMRDYNEFATKRNQKALIFMKELLKDVIEHNASLLRRLANMIREQDLRLAISIDEAAACPLLIRSVTGDTEMMRGVVRTAFQEFMGLNVPVEGVVFSIAGTGASGGSIGSEPKNWKEWRTSASEQPTKMYEALRGNYTDVPCYDEMKAWAPVLFTLVKHNARLCSIVIDRIQSLSKVFSFTSVEGRVKKNEPDLTANAIAVFIKANGMEGLLDDPQLASVVGAQTLATRLFGSSASIPNHPSQRVGLHTSFNYGITTKFDGNDSTVSMQQLVARYGIVTPEALPEVALNNQSNGASQELPKPFLVDDAMIIVALHLLGLPEGKGPVDPGFDGFEVSATQIVRGALAASATMKEEFRPSVRDTLAKVGFRASKQPSATNGDDLPDNKIMKEFETVKVRRHTKDRNGNNEFDFRKTYLQTSPMRLSDGLSNTTDLQHTISLDRTIEKVPHVRKKASRDAVKKTRAAKRAVGKSAGGKSSRTDQDRAAEEAVRAAEEAVAKVKALCNDFAEGTDGILIIDDDLLRLLMQLGARVDKEAAREDLFPFATVAFSNSELADGYVVFFGFSEDQPHPVVYTIEIQGKDYSRGVGLDVVKINKNAVRCRSPLLDAAFGKQRLFCVASRSEQLDADAKTITRDYYAFHVDKSEILGDLMQDLYKNRPEQKFRGTGIFVEGRVPFKFERKGQEVG